MIKNIKELNELVYESEQKIVQRSARATFKSSVADSIRLVLYKNGISLFNGPFRSFNDFKTQRFCIDIMDGYFPSELQDRYPDGVPFDVIDKREKIFEDKLEKVLESKGYRLGDTIETTETRDDSTIETQLTGISYFNFIFLFKSLNVCFKKNRYKANNKSIFKQTSKLCDQKRKCFKYKKRDI